MLKISLRVFCGLLGVIVTAAVLRSDQAKEQVEIGSQKLVSALRLLNTGEALYRQQYGRFASRDEMLTFLKDKSELGQSPIALDNPKPYELAITTSSDGTHYQIGLRRPSNMEDRSTWCKTAGFSDDRGVIFLGVALGCGEISRSTPQANN
jgi:hypothetical protein